MANRTERLLPDRNPCILRDGNIVPDHWSLSVSREEPNPEQATVFTLDHWQLLDPAHRPPAGKAGLLLTAADPLAAVVEDLHHLHLICLEIPVATDGRSYSRARLLRQRYGYQHELRAVGDVRVDQLFLLTRCGFNSFSFTNEADLHQATQYLHPFDSGYQ